MYPTRLNLPIYLSHTLQVSRVKSPFLYAPKNSHRYFFSHKETEPQTYPY